MTAANTIELSDIQGLIKRSFSSLPAACYLLISIDDPQKALPWLRSLAKRITYADILPDELAINLAVTYHGLKKLQINQAILNRFSDEFRSGMSTEHKRHILGDEGANAPEHWLWGGPATKQVDILLLCYGQNDKKLNTIIDDLIAEISIHGLKMIEKLETKQLIGSKEHFGFHDGVGQPHIAEFSSRQMKKLKPVPLGEILLGYRNGYDRYTQSPHVDAEQDPHKLLSNTPDCQDQHDLGFNGTYLVFRQLSQDVPAFWRTLNQLANSNAQRQDKAQSGEKATAETIRLAAKMVGRWPSGTSLVQSPVKDDPNIVDKDSFTYHESDADGLKCPLGAHIRRTNPRDSLAPQPGSEKSLAFSNRHRILRRGRAYGKPFDASMSPAKFLKKLDQEAVPVARGLHFICLNANIGRQFEFVQHTWANNPNFNGLYQDPDPIVGTRLVNGVQQDKFTVQRHPSRLQHSGLPSFVQTRGGGYFFLPSRRALAYLLS
jgi:Dyp-type peroxidase family